MPTSKDHPPRTFAGEVVKSREELQIANYLFRNNVRYEYEQRYEHNTRTPEHSQYMPDFFLPDLNVYLEHFGLSADGQPPPHFSEKDKKAYLEGFEWKKALHVEMGTAMLQTFSWQFADGSIWEALGRQIEEAGGGLEPMSAKELIESMEGDEAVRKIGALLANFLNLKKDRSLSDQELRELATKDQTTSPLLRLLKFSDYQCKRFAAFLRIYFPVQEAYQNELSSSDSIDFNDMISMAAGHVKSGGFKPPWKYILVDEFQDISGARAGLVKALIDSNPGTVLMCVGDDWQAIYRFAGSDLVYTRQFEERFGPTERIDLDKTFRFNNGISDLATRFISKNPAQIEKEIHTHVVTDEPTVELWMHEEDEDETCTAILDSINAEASRASVYLIGRYRHLKPENLSVLTNSYPNLKIIYDTAHASKGKEADYVIVIGLNQGRYGFPSDIVSDPLEELLLPEREDFEDAEERRLFYVAVTRAKKRTYLVADRGEPSRFVQELLREQDQYRFLLRDGRGDPTATANVVNCEHCGSGTAKRRTNRKTGEQFYGCSNWKLCTGKIWECPECKNGPLQASSTHRSCALCGYQESICPECRNGRLLKRKGPYGEFWGCSNWRKGSEFACKYKRKVE